MEVYLQNQIRASSNLISTLYPKSKTIPKISIQTMKPFCRPILSRL